ncbi:MAG: ATP-dependent Clp protease ATP-binding subunit ClpX [Firmicutes bacterium]|nr:ATP-dependent Clp protease ATP-binding subunit ClpX [Bacillota bacterium]
MNNTENASGKETKVNLPTPVQIRAHLDEYVIGQDDAKRVLAVAVYNHYKRVLLGSDVEIGKSNIMMIGPTGSGKTYIVSTLAKMLGVPFAMADATTLVGSMHPAKEIENILATLIQNANLDTKQAERGIIYIDEIDKVAKRYAPHGEGIQQALLKIIEKTIAAVPIAGQVYQVDTGNILFIVGGAFVGLDTLVQLRTSGSAIVIQEGESEKLLKNLAVEDIAKYGLIPEFVGRLPVIVTLEGLNIQALSDILTKPKNALITQYKKMFELDNVELVFDEESIQKIAEKAVKLKTGARGLRTILEGYMRDIMYKVPSEQNLHKVIISKDVIAGEEDAVFEYNVTIEEEELLPLVPKAMRGKTAES